MDLQENAEIGLSQAAVGDKASGGLPIVRVVADM